MTKTEIESATPSELNRLIHLHVLGDDLTANTDERIEESVGEVVRLIHYWHCFKHKVCDYGLSNNVPRLAWNEREGKPYQSDLEAHVPLGVRMLRIGARLARRLSCLRVTTTASISGGNLIGLSLISSCSN